MSISPSSGARGLRRFHFQNMKMYQNGKVDSLWGSTLPKIRITSKNALNKSCSQLNFVQESQWACMYISPRSGARSL